MSSGSYGKEYAALTEEENIYAMEAELCGMSVAEYRESIGDPVEPALPPVSAPPPLPTPEEESDPVVALERPEPQTKSGEAAPSFLQSVKDGWAFANRIEHDKARASLELQRKVAKGAGAVAKDIGTSVATGEAATQLLVGGPMDAAAGFVRAIDDLNSYVGENLGVTPLATPDQTNWKKHGPNPDAIATWLEEHAYEDPRTGTGAFMRTTGEFLTMFIPLMGQANKVRKGLGLVGATRSARIAEHVVAPGLAGAGSAFIVTDPVEEKLSEFLKKHPDLEEPIEAYLNSSAPSKRMEERLRASLAEFVLGMGIDWGIYGLRALRAARLASRSEMPTEALEPHMMTKDEMLSQHRERLAEEGTPIDELPVEDAAPGQVPDVEPPPTAAAAEPAAAVEDLSKFDYRKLQQRAKGAGIRANQKKDDLVAALEAERARAAEGEQLALDPDQRAQAEVVPVETPEAGVMREMFKGEDTKGKCVRCAPQLAKEIGGEVVEGLVWSRPEGKRIRHKWVEKDGIVYDADSRVATKKADWDRALDAQETHRIGGEEAFEIARKANKWRFLTPKETFEQLEAAPRPTEAPTPRAAEAPTPHEKVATSEIWEDAALAIEDLGREATDDAIRERLIRKGYTGIEGQGRWSDAAEPEAAAEEAVPRAEAPAVDPEEALIAEHKEQILQAIAERKAVPREVFESYPELVDEFPREFQMAFRRDGPSFEEMPEEATHLGDVDAPRMAVVVRDREASEEAVSRAMVRLEREHPDLTPGELEMWARDEATEVEINMARIDSDDDIKQLIQDVTDVSKGPVDKARRGKRSNAVTSAAATRMGMTVDQLLAIRRGQALNAEEGLAARRIWIAMSEQLENFANRAADRNATPDDHFRFRKSLAVFQAVNEKVLGMQAEAGRALQAFRIPASAGPNERFRVVESLMGQLGGAEVTQELARNMAVAMKAGAGEGAVGNLIKGSVSARTMNAARELFINSLLWSPKTHMVNMVGNSLIIAHQNLLKSAAVRYRLAIGGEGVAMGEDLAQLNGQMAGIRTMFSMSAPAREVRQDILERIPGTRESKYETTLATRGAASPSPAVSDPNAISGAQFRATKAPLAFGIDIFGSTVRTPGRLLQAEDSLFKIVGYTGEVHAQAHREAVRIGGTADEIMENYKRLVDNPTEDIRLAAADTALYNTLTRAPSDPTKALINFRESLNPMFVLLPFMRVVDNVLRYSFENSPLAPLSRQFREDIAAGGARHDMAMARWGVGTASFMVFMDLAYNGLVTADGPSDREARASQKRIGWQQHAINIGGTYYNYSRLDPLGMQLGIAAKIAEILRERDVGGPEAERDLSEIMAAVLLSSATTALDKTYMTGVSNLVLALEDSKRFGPIFINRTLQSTTPFSTALRTGVQATNPTRAAYETPLEAIQAMIPIWEQSLPRLLDVHGHPVGDAGVYGRVYDVVSPVRVTETTVGNHIDHELVRLQSGISKIPRSVGFSVGRGAPSVPVNMRNFPRVYEELQRLAGHGFEVEGKGRLEFLNDMVDPESGSPYSKIYWGRDMTDGPDGSRVDFIKQVAGQYTKAAKGYLFHDPDGVYQSEEYQEFREYVHKESARLRTAITPERLRKDVPTGQMLTGTLGPPMTVPQ